jgi:multidrug resistance efflux pump
MSKTLAFARALVAVVCGSGAALYYANNWRQDAGGPAASPEGPLPAMRWAKVPPGAIICSGRVEPVRGEVNITAQVGGQLAEVRVKEGDMVEQGQVLAILEGPRQAAELALAEAGVALARSEVRRLEAGNGREEIAQARFDAESVEAALEYEARSLGRLQRLLQRGAVSADDFDRQRQRVEQLRRQGGGLRQRYEALRRGALPEEVDVARSKLAAAEARVRRLQVELDLRVVRAPTPGTILEVFRHVGDSVSTDQPSPILRMADTTGLRIRLEVDEVWVAHVKPGQEGVFRIRGTRLTPAGSL